MQSDESDKCFVNIFGVISMIDVLISDKNKWVDAIFSISFVTLNLLSPMCLA